MDQVRDLAHLVALAAEHRSVWLGHRAPRGVVFHRPLPAAVVVNWQGTMIHRWLTKGLYVYDKKESVNTPAISGRTKR